MGWEIFRDEDGLFRFLLRANWVCFVGADGVDPCCEPLNLKRAVDRRSEDVKERSEASVTGGTAQCHIVLPVRRKFASELADETVRPTFEQRRCLLVGQAVLPVGSLYEPFFFRE